MGEDSEIFYLSRYFDDSGIIQRHRHRNYTKNSDIVSIQITQTQALYRRRNYPEKKED